MAIDKRTAYLDAYKEMLVFIPFLSSFFVTRPRDIVNAESFKIDIKRGTRKIAPVISNVTQIGGKIKKSIYTQKEFTPPVVAVSGDFAPGDLLEKIFGKDEYSSSEESYSMQLQENVSETMQEADTQIARNPEYQASQILQTGAMTLYDDNGVAAYTINFFPKASHFPTVGTNWSDPASDPDADITALRRQIKTDSGAAMKNIVFGETALANYLANPNVVSKFDNRRIISGEFNPDELHPDADFLGDIMVGNKRMAAWIYEGEYEDPANPGTIKPFVDADKVLLLPDPTGANVDLRKVWCRVPTITGVDPRFADLIPSQMNTGDRQMTVRVWVEGSADSLNVELKARPLCVPVSIDSFGCLDTVI